MPRHTRRSVLKVTGALLGGIAVGSQVTAATSTERFIVDARGVSYDHPDLEVIHDLPEVDLAVVEGPAATLEDLGADFAPDVTYELDQPVDAEVLPAASEALDEPFYGLQWDKQAQGIPAAHEVTRGEGTRVAIIDSGVAASHPDLTVNAALSRNFTTDSLGAPGPWGGGHGTHVAGIVGASDENDVGVVGSAPGTELVDCRVFSSVEGEGATFGDIVAAMVYSAAVGCDVANLSLGAYPVPRQELGEFYGRVLNRSTAFARRNGTLLVVAAGNDATDLQHDGDVISLPNEAANVMSVSATGPIGFQWGESPAPAQPPSQPAVYTNYGTNAIDVSAPGGNYDASAIGSGRPWYYDLVLNTYASVVRDDDGNIRGARTNWSWLAGTSMAAPQVAGAAALVKSAAPNLNANQVRSAIRRTATDGPVVKEYHGAGHLDPLAAVEDAAGGGGRGNGNGRGP